MEDLFQVGVITTTHGVRGEVKVFPTTDDPARFKKLKNVLLDTGKEKLALEISQVKFFKNLVILKFRGIDNINDVEKYKGKSLLIAREQAVKCEEGEYFIADLIGLEVKTEEGQLLGEVKDVLQTGANDVYIIQVAPDSPYSSRVSNKKKELLLPAIQECIRKIDIADKTMQVHLMAGLLEEGME
ncbi:MAG: 16S rRNA processing protein RimM [Lachnospiraceae bacterium]|jgi:16S rRNA processing protein RimM|nr:16S rRNA processing protein RimM [Lachnospiraceae bacterium]MCI8872406.1 16S rRNA processing protein RimM [Lachnospiraceae bacterium]GFI29436.1 ribosome maturation factor RimM [Lachnospiraceae bacterium]